MALYLAQDRGRGVGGELKSAVGVKAVEGLDEADRAHLDEVVERLATVLELAREEAHEVEVAHHELAARVLVALLLVEAEELARAGLVPGELALGRAREVSRSGRRGTSRLGALLGGELCRFVRHRQRPHSS